MSCSSYEPPAYLVEYLNEIAKREGFIEHSLNFEQGSNHGDGFIASVIAVSIKGKQMVDIQEDKELSLICKLLPENKARRDMFNSTILFDREVYVYNEVFPLFEKFQIEKHISIDEGFFNYPKCYLAVSDANKDHYVIIMDNFKVVGYELWDKMKPVDFDTSSIFLAYLGRLHGLSFALRDQRPELFQKLQNMEGVMTVLIELPSIVAMLMSSFDKAINILIREDDINLLKKIRDNFKPIIKKFFTNGTWNIFCHGDCWNNNFCFSSDENIESLDDHSGRLLIKLALGGTKEWFNEFMVQPVSKAEYAQYGKVINSAKYEEYKKKQEEKERLSNLKIEKFDSSSSKGNVDRQDRPRKINSRSSDDERCRVGSSDSRKHRSTRDRHSGNSNDDDKHSSRTSKSNNYKKRDSSEDSTHGRSRNYSSHKQSTRKEIQLSSDENDDRSKKHSSSHKSSHKKTKSKKHFKSRSYSKDHRQHYDSSDDDEKHHKKKTKKSKRPRSRSRDRR